MGKLKNNKRESTNPGLEKRDIMTEMFEHFGIEIVDVTPEKSKSSKQLTESDIISYISSAEE